MDLSVLHRDSDVETTLCNWVLRCKLPVAKYLRNYETRIQKIKSIYKVNNDVSFLECFRKPRINSQLVAQQVAQQYATPPPPKKEKKEKVEKQDKEKPEKDKETSPGVTKKNTNKKTK